LKITIELDLANERDAATYLALAEHALGGEVDVKATRKKKPTTPVAGNPDAPPATGATAAEATADKPREAAPAAPVAPVEPKVRDTAPDEIKALVGKSDRETVGKAVLKAAKPVAEGGLTRAVVVPILEKLAGVEPGTAVKMGMVPDAKIAELRLTIMQQYAA